MSIQRKSPLKLCGGLALAGLGTPDFWPVTVEAARNPLAITGCVAIAEVSVPFSSPGFTIEAIKLELQVGSQSMGDGRFSDTDGKFSAGQRTTLVDHSNINFNGEAVSLFRYDTANQLWEVMMDEDFKRISVSQGNLQAIEGGFLGGPPVVPLLFAGGRVKLVGLSQRGELNGSEGTVGAFDSDLRRWTIILDTGSIKCRRKNLEPLSVRPTGLSSPVIGDAVMLTGLRLTRCAANNGKIGVLVGVDGEGQTLRYKVKLSESSEILAARPENVLARGERALLTSDLRHLNQEIVTVWKLDGQTSQCWVLLDGPRRKEIQVVPDQLKRIEEGMSWPRHLLYIGQRVELIGLTHDGPRLNGLKGVVIEFDDESRRYTISLDGGQRKMCLRKNLKHADFGW